MHEKKINVALDYVDERTAMYCLYFVCLDADGEEDKTCGTHPIMVGKLSYHADEDRVEHFHQYEDGFKLTSENIGKVLQFLQTTERKFVERMGRTNRVEKGGGKRARVK